GCQPGWPRTNNGDSLACTYYGRLGLDPSLFPGALHDCFFDYLDRDGRLIDPQHAGGFAGGRTDPSCKLRKIVGGMQDADGFLPVIAINQVVPVRNNVGDRTASVAKRNAAVHAARGLHPYFLFGEWLIHLEVVVDTLRDRAARRRLACVFLEACNLTHRSPAHAPAPASWHAQPPLRREFVECPGRACIRAG